MATVLGLHKLLRTRQVSSSILEITAKGGGKTMAEPNEQRFLLRSTSRKVILCMAS